MVRDDTLRPHGQRLTALRHIKELTQIELADKLSVSQSFLSHIERGHRPMPETLVHRASYEYGVPLTFFTVKATPMDSGPVTFRKSSRASLRDEERVRGYYDEAARLFRSVSASSAYITADLPDPFDYDYDPEKISQALRFAAGVSEDAPILNVTRTLERFGIGVVDNLDVVDAEGGHVGISRPSALNDRPLVALASDLPGAVKRLTLLHETCHLIFDRHLDHPITSTRSPEEQRAFRFAGAFLLPARVVRQRVTESLNLHGYLPIKADYGISVSAIIRRARDLSIISPSRYRSLSIQWSSQGWRTNEPVPVANERPLLLSQALRKVYGPHFAGRASQNIGTAPEWINQWTHTLVDADHSASSASVIDLFPARTKRSEARRDNHA